MTSEDYFNWAAEYRREAEAVEHRIKSKKQQYKSTRGNIEKIAIEKSLSALYDQRIQCICTAKELEERARAIREKEG